VSGSACFFCLAAIIIYVPTMTWRSCLAAVQGRRCQSAAEKAEANVSPANSNQSINIGFGAAVGTQRLRGPCEPGYRFPLLLKFLDAREMLSAQVHPSDAHKDPLPAGESGKTEARVVVQRGYKSRIYAGLKPGIDSGDVGERSPMGQWRTS